MREPDYETHLQAKRGQLTAAQGAEWAKRLASDARLAAEVREDESLSRLLDQMHEIEPSRGSLARIQDAVGGSADDDAGDEAPVLPMRGWRRYWPLEVGFAAAAVIAVVVLFNVLPGSDPGNGGGLEAREDSTTYLPQVEWDESDDDGYESYVLSTVPEAETTELEHELMAALLQIESMKQGMAWKVREAEETAKLGEFEDWREVVKELKY